jgi:hypothetical protein
LLQRARSAAKGGRADVLRAIDAKTHRDRFQPADGDVPAPHHAVDFPGFLLKVSWFVIAFALEKAFI